MSLIPTAISAWSGTTDQSTGMDTRRSDVDDASSSDVSQCISPTTRAYDASDASSEKVTVSYRNTDGADATPETRLTIASTEVWAEAFLSRWRSRCRVASSSSFAAASKYAVAFVVCSAYPTDSRGNIPPASAPSYVTGRGLCAGTFATNSNAGSASSSRMKITDDASIGALAVAAFVAETSTISKNSISSPSCAASSTMGTTTSRTAPARAPASHRTVAVAVGRPTFGPRPLERKSSPSRAVTPRSSAVASTGATASAWRSLRRTRARTKPEPSSAIISCAIISTTGAESRVAEETSDTSSGAEETSDTSSGAEETSDASSGASHAIALERTSIASTRNPADGGSHTTRSSPRTVARVVRVPRTYGATTDTPPSFEFEFEFTSGRMVSRSNPSNAHVAETFAAGANPAPRSSTRSNGEGARISGGTVASLHARVAKRRRDAGSSSAGRAMRRGVGEGSSSSSSAAGAGAGTGAGAGSRHATVTVKAPASSAPARASGFGPPRGGNAHVTTVGS